MLRNKALHMGLCKDGLGRPSRWPDVSRQCPNSKSQRALLQAAKGQQGPSGPNSAAQPEQDTTSSSSSSSSSVQQEEGPAPLTTPTSNPSSSTAPRLNRGSSYWVVPWDIWDTIQFTALLYITNQAIPFTGLSLVAWLQYTTLAELPLSEKEVFGTIAQFVQLAATVTIVRAATAKYHPLPKPWFLLDVNPYALIQGLAGAVAAVGSGVLVAGVLSGASDGAEEWRQLVRFQGTPDAASIALVLGAMVLAPANEELMFRGYVLPSLTKWCHPVVAVILTAGLFASAHPSTTLLPEFLVGCVLGTSLLAAEGNLLVPGLTHSMYNGMVIAAELLLRGHSTVGA